MNDFLHNSACELGITRRFAMKFPYRLASLDGAPTVQSVTGDGGAAAVGGIRARRWPWSQAFFSVAIVCGPDARQTCSGVVGESSVMPYY